MSKAGKRIVAGLIGVGVALVYGLWTMLATGGGHINFIWLWLFIAVEGFGLYFPVMTILLVDLRPRLAKIVFGSLILFNVVASTVLIHGWITQTGASQLSDFEWTIRASGIGGLVLDLVLHFLPTLVFISLLARSMFMEVSQNSMGEENRMIELKLS